MAFKLFLLLASIATLAHGTSHKALLERSVLEPRADCQPGATTCSVQGLITYCANPGNKCCDARNSAPISATCCPLGYYARQGSYCCAEGGSCTNGRSCTGCTPVSGTGGFIASVPVVQSSVPATTQAPTSTRVAPPNLTYFTFTITYYYWQLYYIYVQSLSRSTATSSTVTTTTTVSVFASNSAAAQSSFAALSATLSLPTPLSATFLPPLPSQTSSVVIASATSAALGPTNTSVVSPSPSQFRGGAGQQAVGGSSYKSLTACVVAVMIGMVGFGMNMVL